LQLISGRSSPVTVTCDLSPVKLPLKRFIEGKRCNLSMIGENVADWKRCAREFVCDSEVKPVSSFVSGKCIQQRRRTLTDANARHQPRAKKRLASALANEVLPLKLTGECSN